LYNKQKNAKGTGPTGQLYRSKNGRVYYRDKEGRAHWVTPPAGGIQVPPNEAPQYSGYQGYNGQTTGATFGGFGPPNQPLASRGRGGAARTRGVARGGGGGEGSDVVSMGDSPRRGGALPPGARRKGDEGGRIRPASRAPRGDPADEEQFGRQVLPASQDPYG